MLNDLLNEVWKAHGSDLHLINGMPPTLRIDNKIKRLYDKPIDTDAERLISQILSPEQQHKLLNRGDADASYEFTVPDGTKVRTRVNIYRDTAGISVAFRLIPNEIPTMENLMIPMSIRRMTQASHGLVLVTGPTGAGKTTTLAAMLQEIANTRECNIITLEDPIEYKLTPEAAIISQREIGQHCDSFATGLKAALRQDPDIIMVGELRDMETIGTALAAAETGHLVFATLHTATVIEAVDRMTQYFPLSDRKAVLMELANSFIGIIAQRLFVKKKEPGRVAAYEILTRTDATVNMIRSDAIFRCSDYMRPEQGMQTMERAIQGLENLNLI